MEKAKNGEVYDFKITNGIHGHREHDIYRGMPVQIGNITCIASARDVGNYVAGYYAGANGFSWAASRLAFDIYQGGIEGFQTQSAEYVGWKNGNRQDLEIKIDNITESIPSLKVYKLIK